MNQELTALMEDYASLAKKHISLKEVGERRRANSVHRQLVRLYKKILGKGPEGDTVLLRLINHIDPAVRLWAAADSRSIDPVLAKKTLERLVVEDEGITGLEAQLLLSMSLPPLRMPGRS